MRAGGGGVRMGRVTVGGGGVTVGRQSVPCASWPWAPWPCSSVLCFLDMVRVSRMPISRRPTSASIRSEGSHRMRAPLMNTLTRPMGRRIFQPSVWIWS